MQKFVGAACAAAALFVSASVADAATVYQTTFQGATFTVTQNSSTNITFDIAGANALTVIGPALSISAHSRSRASAPPR